MFFDLSAFDLAELARVFVEIALLTVVIYRIYLSIAGTKVTEVISFIFGIALVYLLSAAFGLSVITYLVEKLLFPFLMLLAIVYHPELRRAFSGSVMKKSRFFRIGGQTTSDQIDSILNACNILVEKKRGALIVFPRHTDIQSILDSGTKLNADLSSTLILTIFDHDTPLHDGAAVVSGGRIAYAACYLPLSEQKGIKATFGTRHRAALGLAEESDAVVLIVSEETGAISLAYNANIYYDLSNATIKRTILSLFSYRDVMPDTVSKEAVNEAE